MRVLAETMNDDVDLDLRQNFAVYNYLLSLNKYKYN